MQAVNAIAKRVLITLLIGSILPVFAYADKRLGDARTEKAKTDACDAIAGLKDIKVMEGNFQQEKILPVLKKNLLSSGRFLSVKKRGLLWKVERPVPVHMVFTPGVVKQYTDKGVKEIKATGTAYDGIAILLPALFDNDVDLLQKYFELRGEKDGDCWELFLKPKSDKLDKLITSVVIKGKGPVINKAVLKGAENDVTNITFTHVRSSEKPATPEQLSWFL